MIHVTAPADRPVTLATPSTGTVFLRPGEGRKVLDCFAAVAAEKGCSVQPVGNGSAPAPAADPAEAESEKAGKIRDAVQLVIDRGDPNDFNTNGQPKKQAVQTLVGGRVTAAEVQDAYEQIMAS